MLLRRRTTVGARRTRRAPTRTSKHATWAPRVEHRRGRRPGRLAQRGTVTAETALVLPMLVAVTLAMAWTLSLAATQVRVVDAAREVARAAARDETRPDAVSLGRRVAPKGSSIRIVEDGTAVVARVRAHVNGPGGLLSFLPEVEIASEAVAAKEQQ